MADRIAKVPDLYPTAEEPPLAEPALQQPKVAAPVAGAAILGWRSLTVTVKKNGAQILKNVQGVISGGFTAVMGPSGCGKSSLLNTLALRLDKAVAQTGDIRLNGCAYTRRQLKLCSGYVMQDDLLNGTFTVLETLDFTARLKLPPTISVAERTLRIEQVSKAMGLAHILHVNVGDPLHKGISGGERKRLCVAMELLTKPALLFLDEPTSGLDSVTALSLVRSLRALSDSGACTIVCTIHQPQAKIFALFDNLFLLKSGSNLIPNRNCDLKVRGHIPSHLISSYPPPPPCCPPPPARARCLPTTPLAQRARHLTHRCARLPRPRALCPAMCQFSVLFRRKMLKIWRKRELLQIQAAQTTLMGLLVGCTFLLVGDTQESIDKRQSLMFFCVINQGVFSALMVVNSFPQERALSLRERAAGTYTASAYFLAETTAETMPYAAFPTMFALCVYFQGGLAYTGGQWFIFAIFLILTNLSAASLALAVSAIAKTTDLSVVVLPILLELSRVTGGYFLSDRLMPLSFSWLYSLSYVKYAYTAISLNQLTGLVLHCTPEELPAHGVCLVTSGEQVIQKLGFDYISIGGCAGVLLFYIVGCRVIAYLGIRYL
ncbi:P-loop containing nucleoside triphosphate hydrolase protein [Pavlovales sp. CCMP2436]|nr:P-loop containing nucleoside triphosphate hydrolase protein [Pavlovales sp. CCMP2436]